ncbi:MAG: DedA family protein [Armatimonadota bacterium]
MHAFIQGLLQWYFGILEQFGLLGVVVLMAMESSIFPVPSELVVPPAAYLESHMKGGALPLTLLVILAGTVGSFIGASVTYWISRWIGRPLIVKYGKYIFIPEHKLHVAERWVARYGAGGIFFARLLPVVRHVISIPAGIAGLRFRTFASMTILGSAIWCTVLTIFGMMMAADMEMVIRGGVDMESAGYKQAFQNLTLATIGMVAVIGVLYALIMRRQPAPAVEETIPAER